MNRARAKVEVEGQCRVCGLGGPERLDAAHTWDRSLGGPGWDDPDAVVPLCSRVKGGVGCHEAYDHHELDLRPYLTPEEAAAMVRYAGSASRAERRARGVVSSARPRDTTSDTGPF